MQPSDNLTVELITTKIVTKIIRPPELQFIIKYKYMYMLTDFRCSVNLKDILYSLQSNKNVYTCISCIVNIYIHEDGL